MKVHGIVCTYLGDGEYDIGKTAAWLNSYVNTLFFYDLNYGEAGRKYMVDYAKTFPDAEFAYHPATSPGFYANAPLFRQMAFQAALKAWGYADGDWVVFIDASESVSTNKAYDQQALDTEWPTLINALLEAARAGINVLKLPFHVFLQQGTVTDEYMSADAALGNRLVEQIDNKEDEIAAETDPVAKAALQVELDALLLLQQTNDSVLYWTNDPHYLSDTLALDRMFRVSYLKTQVPTAQAWKGIDTFSLAIGTVPANGVAVVAYGYARYDDGQEHIPPSSLDDSVPYGIEPYGTGPYGGSGAQVVSLSLGTDGGFVNRLLLQQVRDVGLPEDYNEPDPVGVAHPVGTQSPAYAYLYSQYDTGDGNPEFNKYVALWRQNPRDGVWYINHDLGPVPTDPLTGNPSVDPDDWSNQPTSTTGPAGTGRP